MTTTHRLSPIKLNIPEELSPEELQPLSLQMKAVQMQLRASVNYTHMLRNSTLAFQVRLKEGKREINYVVQGT